jgi:hypothetical protein
LWGSFILASVAFALPEQSAGKEVAGSSPLQQWFADTEWDLGAFGAYASPNSEIRSDKVLPKTSLSTDLARGYLNADHAWGGGIDARYFFHRFLGLGIEGDVLTDNGLVTYGRGEDSTTLEFRTQRKPGVIGLALGTVSLRYPIGSSRFAPYVFAGAGAIFGGGAQSILTGPHYYLIAHHGSQTEAVGQFGGGIEVRLTPNIGVTNDFSWNVVSGRNNNFGIFRSGFNFAFAAGAKSPAERLAGKEAEQSPAGLPWLAEREWDLSVSGSYAYAGNNDRKDRYLGADHAWGGGVSACYFFQPYVGVGLKGDFLDAGRTSLERNGYVTFGTFSGTSTLTKVNRAITSVLGDITGRYPIPHTRLVPYAYAGVGGILGGGERDELRAVPGSYMFNAVQVFTKHTESRAELMGQFGAGLEFRLTQHIGLTNDFGWNVVNGRKNNFGIVRSGLNFAF